MPVAAHGALIQVVIQPSLSARPQAVIVVGDGTI